MIESSPEVHDLDVDETQIAIYYGLAEPEADAATEGEVLPDETAIAPKRSARPSARRSRRASDRSIAASRPA